MYLYLTRRYVRMHRLAAIRQKAADYGTTRSEIVNVGLRCGLIYSVRIHTLILGSLTLPASSHSFINAVNKNQPAEMRKMQSTFQTHTTYFCIQSTSSK